ncbi:hypothetical protein KX816_12715 [Sphingosinicellaceae bacterium]|nr:hypothetical protein KX816_12715 [Sphingosinicellaceae bacterium]
MRRLDLAFLYDLGTRIRPLRNLTPTTVDLTYSENYFAIKIARDALAEVLYQSIFSPIFRPPTLIAGQNLIDLLDRFIKEMADSDEWTKSLSVYDIVQLNSLQPKFETIFIADLQTAAAYFVSQKSGFDTQALTESGEVVFSIELLTKVPSVVNDLRQATRCIAFELPTAAGFHLHRANEGVLRVYYDVVTSGRLRPHNNSMGDYLKVLNDLNVGRLEVREHLKSIKDFHRNPLMHPEQTLETVDEAIDLMAAIRSSIGYMLREIPAQTVEEPLLPIGLTEAALPNSDDI